MHSEAVNTPDFRLKNIDRQIFRKIMVNIKGNRVHGVDWIDNYCLKISAPLIEDSLIHLISLSISQGVFASAWKPQLILPLHKKKSKDRVENFRPVCHLVQVGKLAEIA